MSVLTIDHPSYEAKVRQAQELLRDMPRGTQQEMSFDLRVNATIVSQVVAGIRVDEALLQRIIVWLESR